MECGESYVVSGVRPSPGAATLGRGLATEPSTTLDSAELSQKDFHTLDLGQPSWTKAYPVRSRLPYPALTPLPIGLADSISLLVTVDHWADEINRWNDLQTTNLVAFGCLIHASKLALKRGQWEELFRRRRQNRIPFGKSTGKKWDLIGEVCGPNGQEPDHLKNLPWRFEALYQISRLGLPLLLDLMAAGDIRPDLSEAKAKELVQKHRPELYKPRPFNMKNCLAQLDRLLGVIEENGGSEHREEVVRKFKEGIKRLKTKGTIGTEANGDNAGKVE